MHKRIIEKGTRAVNLARAKGLGVYELLRLKGDTIPLMKALQRIDAVKGRLTQGEIKTASRIVEKLSHKAAIRETELLFGKKTNDEPFESDRGELYFQLAVINRESLLVKLEHGKELRAHITEKKENKPRPQRTY